MNEPYVIRLRGPWEFQPLERMVLVAAGEYRRQTDQLPPGGRARVPDDWHEALGVEFRGRVRYTRRFNCPTNLGARDRVWLVCEGADHRASVAMNEQALFEMVGAEHPAGHDVTEMLQPRNTVTIDVSLDPEDTARPPDRQGKAGGLIGEVRLEIRQQ